MIKYFNTSIPEPLVKENAFIGAAPATGALPTFEQAKPILPEPFWDGHASAIECYWKVWQLAFKNLWPASKEAGFPSPFIDSAFNDAIFMWDTAFILIFTRYGARAFDFQQTLDNFYARQHDDGFICRQIRRTDGGDAFHKYDPSATGPHVLPWAEWEYFATTGDKARLAKVFPPLLAFHRWMRKYRTWPDGSYWATGWSCGMDNIPRQPELPVFGDNKIAFDGWKLVPMWHHGYMTWVDTCLQQILSGRVLDRMAAVLGRSAETAMDRAEAESLSKFVEDKLWNEKQRFFVDRFADGSLSQVKTIGAYWALLAGTGTPTQRAALTAHLRDPKTFGRPHPVPALSADDPAYNAKGDYWNGGVWPSTQCMVLQGLDHAGEHALAHEIGLKHHDQVVKVFEATGTVWENYAPEGTAEGTPSKGDMVGWGGIGPVAVLFEQVFGLRPDVPARKLVWDIRLTEAFGVKRYPFGPTASLDLHCAARKSASERPVVTIKANERMDVEIRWDGGSEVVKV